MKKLYFVCLLLAALLTSIGIVTSGAKVCCMPGSTSRHITDTDTDTIPKGKASTIKNDTSLIPLTRSNPRDPRWITDTVVTKIPLSSNPYYPDLEVPSQQDGYTISGGRFGTNDLTNIVYHAQLKRDSLGILIRLGDSWVDFFDMDNRFRGTFNITKNNPYTADKYSPFLSEGYYNAASGVIDMRANPGYNWRKHVVMYATSGGTYDNRSCETLVIAYYLQALDGQYNLLGVLTTFILLENHGREVARFEDVEDVFFGEGILTCDHRYFCLKYGGDFTVDGGRMYNDRFRIYDVESKEIIYEMEADNGSRFAGPGEYKGGWVRLHHIANGSSVYRYIVFDIKNRIKYTSPNNPRLNYIRAMTEDGFIIKDQVTGEFERIWYEDWHAERF